jgi:hypothetical protein
MERLEYLKACIARNEGRIVKMSDPIFAHALAIITKQTDDMKAERDTLLPPPPPPEPEPEPEPELPEPESEPE